VSADEKKPTRTRSAAAKDATEKPAPRAKASTAKASTAKSSTAKASTGTAATDKPATSKGATSKGATPKGEAAAATPKAATARSGGYRQPEYSGLRQRYREDVAPALRREFGYANPMQIPRVSKVVVNIGLGEAIANAKALDAAVGDLTTITGQKPIVTRATRSIAQFRLRTGMPIGAKVTLRGQRMYDFLERTMSLALPRIRDFRGIPTRSFDGRGNFSLGLREQLVYPEIDYDKIDRLRGLEISIVTTAKTDEEGRKLLELMGMPFQSN
jgi:large subunit ribosomal protein L5